MKAMRDVWGETLVALGDTNENLLVLDADLANSTKADKFAKAHPERFLQMGIAEQNFVGAAVGLATVGYAGQRKDWGSLRWCPHWTYGENASRRGRPSNYAGHAGYDGASASRPA